MHLVMFQCGVCVEIRRNVQRAEQHHCSQHKWCLRGHRNWWRQVRSLMLLSREMCIQVNSTHKAILTHVISTLFSLVWLIKLHLAALDEWDMLIRLLRYSLEVVFWWVLWWWSVKLSVVLIIFARSELFLGNKTFIFAQRWSLFW